MQVLQYLRGSLLVKLKNTINQSFVSSSTTLGNAIF